MAEGARISASMPARLLALLLLLAGLAAAHPHKSPSMWVNFEIREHEVECIVVIRRDLLSPWLGDELALQAISDIEKPLGDAEKRKVLVAARDHMARIGPGTPWTDDAVLVPFADEEFPLYMMD